MCLLAAPWVQLSVSAGSGWPHNALRHQVSRPLPFTFTIVIRIRKIMTKITGLFLVDECVQLSCVKLSVINYDNYLMCIFNCI